MGTCDYECPDRSSNLGDRTRSIPLLGFRALTSRRKIVSKSVRLSSALAIVEAARKQAEKIAVPMNIAVVDAGAHLIAFMRMDGAWLVSIEIAQNKAYTARAFDMTTKDLAKISQPGQPAYGVAVSAQHRVAIFPGGIPLKAGDRVIGAIGVSGANPIRITQSRRPVPMPLFLRKRLDRRHLGLRVPAAEVAGVKPRF
jgi:uncharacterized protein GlcG (DUF336 family)